VFSPALFLGAAVGGAFGHCCQMLLPGMEITIATFAIAGMAAAIGGTTGAVLTSIIMLSEMTQDHSIMLPLVIASVAAFAVRRALMDDSVYTMKLRARKHSVPQGLHASLLTSASIADLMSTAFSVVPDVQHIPSDTAYVVIASGETIVDVQRPALGSTSASGTEPAGERLRFGILPLQSTALQAVTALLEDKTDIILVSRDVQSGKATDIVGILEPSTLAHLLNTHHDLS
jgi:CIC family chloride channel protein